MKKTDLGNMNSNDRILVDILTLKELLSCGRTTAEQIGRDAKAEIRVGKRILWNVQKIKEYLNSISK